MPKDYINFMLTGAMATDYSEASCYFLMDSETRSWSSQACETFGLRVDQLPELKLSSDIIGQVTQRAADLTGLPAGIPVVAGTSDMAASLLGSGVYEPGMASDSTGTSTLMTVVSPRPLHHPLVNNLHLANAAWGGFTILDAGGDAVRWARLALADNQITHPQLLQEAAAVPAGAEGLLFLPYLTGERLAEHTNSRAQFFGLQRKHRRGHLFRAVLEGVAFASWRNLRQLQKCGQYPQQMCRKKERGRMFAEERQEKLLGILREKRKVAVSEMCDVFNVSGATIRADLRQLEEEGLLTRTHGGAVLRTRASFEQASDDREIVNLSAKERIGQRAAALVEDGDIIVLDTGTTTLHIARNIRDRQNVTVVTNDYQIARELEASPSIQTILLGGIVKKGYHCVVAINGRSILDTLNVDKAFMGTNSLSLKHGACVADIMLAETKRGMVEHASQVIIVCDYSKLNNTSLAQFTAADRIDTVVVDRLPDDVQAYRNAGIQVISLDEENLL